MAGRGAPRGRGRGSGGDPANVNNPLPADNESGLPGLGFSTLIILFGVGVYNILLSKPAIDVTEHDFNATAWELPKMYEPVNAIEQNMPSLQLPNVEEMGDDTASVNILLDFQNNLQAAEETTSVLLRELDSCLGMFFLNMPEYHVWDGRRKVDNWDQAENDFYSDATQRCGIARPHVKITRETLIKLEGSVLEVQKITELNPNYLKSTRGLAKWFKAPDSHGDLLNWRLHLGEFTSGKESRASRRDAIQSLHRVEHAIERLLYVLSAARGTAVDSRKRDIAKERKRVMELLIFQHKMRYGSQETLDS